MSLSKREEKALKRYESMSAIENHLYENGHKKIAGVDEAGRGPLAGPVYAAAVILDPHNPIYGINDSKKLSAKKRETLAKEIEEKALAYCITKKDVAYIDKYNILNATKAAMLEAINNLKIEPDYVLIDAVTLEDYPEDKQEALVKGDARSNAIAAASILAKVARDHEMIELDSVYPGYGFKQHKGYGTKKHYAALDKLGPTKIHRKKYLRSWYKKRAKND